MSTANAMINSKKNVFNSLKIISSMISYLRINKALYEQVYIFLGNFFTYKYSLIDNNWTSRFFDKNADDLFLVCVSRIHGLFF